MKKYLILLVVLALIVPMAASAQDAGNTENRIFGVHFGFVGGYDLTTEDTVAGRDFGLNFTLSDSMQIGFRSVMGLLSAGDAALLNFGYFLAPNLAIELMVGDADGNIAGGVDAAMYLFKSEDEVFSSSLKMKAGYIFEDNTGIDGGVINAGLIGTVGY